MDKHDRRPVTGRFGVERPRLGAVGDAVEAYQVGREGDRSDEEPGDVAARDEVSGDVPEEQVHPPAVSHAGLEQEVGEHSEGVGGEHPQQRHPNRATRPPGVDRSDSEDHAGADEEVGEPVEPGVVSLVRVVEADLGDGGAQGEHGLAQPVVHGRAPRIVSTSPSSDATAGSRAR